VYDVVVVAASPVGLFLAGELALADCSVLVLERDQEQTSP
jgi:flavin-dependent dehydrogenase